MIDDDDDNNIEKVEDILEEKVNVQEVQKKIILKKITEKINDVTKYNIDSSLLSITSSFEQNGDDNNDVLDLDRLSDGDRKLYDWTVENKENFRLVQSAGKGKTKQTAQRNDLLKYLKCLRISFEKRYYKLTNSVKAANYLYAFRNHRSSKFKFLHYVDKEYWNDVQTTKLIMRLLRLKIYLYWNCILCYLFIIVCYLFIYNCCFVFIIFQYYNIIISYINKTHFLMLPC